MPGILLGTAHVIYFYFSSSKHLSKKEATDKEKMFVKHTPDKGHVSRIYKTLLIPK